MNFFYQRFSHNPFFFIKTTSGKDDDNFVNSLANPVLLIETKLPNV